MIGTANEFNNMWILDVLLKFLCLSTVSTSTYKFIGYWRGQIQATIKQDCCDH